MPFSMLSRQPTLRSTFQYRLRFRGRLQRAGKDNMAASKSGKVVLVKLLDRDSLDF